ncbi:MAG: hypothetical protein WCM76_02875 [Bacteroidota bacterium]
MKNAIELLRQALIKKTGFSNKQTDILLKPVIMNPASSRALINKRESFYL